MFVWEMPILFGFCLCLFGITSILSQFLKCERGGEIQRGKWGRGVATFQDIKNAKSKLSAFDNQENQEVNLNATNAIRELFDDIELIIKSKKAKTENIYDAIKDDIDNISYSHFRTILSTIRKERKTENLTTPLPLPKTDKIVISPKRPSDRSSTVNMNEIILQQEIDRSNYTTEDWANEWNAISKQLQGEKDIRKHYLILGGKSEDIEPYSFNERVTSQDRKKTNANIEAISKLTSQLYSEVSRRYKLRGNIR
jgi:hypothetical protein